MNPNRGSQGVFLFGLAALTLSMIPACGGGGGGSAGAQPPQSGNGHRIHVSSTSGPHVVLNNQPSLPVRTITFTPAGVDDVLLYVRAEATLSVTMVSGLNADQLHLVVKAAGSGATLASANQNLTLTGAGQAYRLQTSGGFQATSYTIELRLQTGATWLGQVDSLLFRIVTAEGVTVVDPSGNIVG